MARVTATTVTPEVVINPNIVATTSPTASSIPSEDAEDLNIEPITDTEVKASNDSVEIVLSVVDKSFAEVVQGRTGRLVAKQGLFARVRGKGFLAGSLAEVWVYSTPRLLAHLQVSSNGDAAGYVLIPDDMEIGDHRVELRGKSVRRRAVKATIPLTIIDDGVPTSTIPPTPEELRTALTLPTKIPAIVVAAPVDGVISIGDDIISSVIGQVLGGSYDLSKIKLRLRVNKGVWQAIDTSTGRVLAVVVPAQEGSNQLDFEVTDEDGRVVVVQREVLVEGTPEAVAAEIRYEPKNEIVTSTLVDAADQGPGMILTRRSPTSLMTAEASLGLFGDHRVASDCQKIPSRDTWTTGGFVVVAVLHTNR